MTKPAILRGRDCLRGMMITLIAAQAFASAPALADDMLPQPFVSRALDAVLMPIDGKVRKAFNLSPKADGVFVVSTQPGGVAAQNDIRAGDVISRVRGKDIVRPVDLDTAVYYWIKHGTTDFVFDGYRGQSIYHPRGSITLALFDAAIDLASIAAWIAWPSSIGWSYGNYYSGYSSYVSETYVTSYNYIETSVSSESYSSVTMAESEATQSFEAEEAEQTVDDQGAAATDTASSDDTKSAESEATQSSEAKETDQTDDEQGAAANETAASDDTTSEDNSSDDSSSNDS